jgi:hypothetical protein
MGYKNHSDKIKYDSDYYYAHREEQIVGRKKRRAEHSEAERETRRLHYRKNCERIKANVKAYREAHPEIAKAYRESHKEEIALRQRKAGLKRYYGITFEEYNTILEGQGGICPICGIRPGEIKKAFAVDHDHETGKVRGILCDRCNLILGYSKDNILILERAINYLETRQGF